MTTGRINQVVTALLSRIKPHSNAKLAKVTFTACSCSAHLHTILISSKTAVNQKLQNSQTPLQCWHKCALSETKNHQQMPQAAKKNAGSQHAMLAAHCNLTLLAITKNATQLHQCQYAHKKQHVRSACTNFQLRN